jgi:hypothetical protein
MPENLNSHHRDTVEKIFAHPTSGNVEWRQVISLLDAIGTTIEKHNGTIEVTLGDQTEVFHPPRTKDIDEQMVVDLRQMLTQAGFAPL